MTDDRAADDPVTRLADDLQIDVERIEAEERAAAYRLSMIEAGRRKGGLLGAAAAGAMIGLRDIYEGPPKQDDIVIEIESSGNRPTSMSTGSWARWTTSTTGRRLLGISATERRCVAHRSAPSSCERNQT